MGDQCVEDLVVDFAQLIGNDPAADREGAAATSKRMIDIGANTQLAFLVVVERFDSAGDLAGIVPVKQRRKIF